MTEKKRSRLQIKLDILHAIKKGMEEGERVNQRYIQNNAQIGHNIFRAYKESLEKDGYIKEEDREYTLSKKAERIVGYERRMNKLKVREYLPSYLFNVPESDGSFKPLKKIKVAKVTEKAFKRNEEEIMAVMLNVIKQGGKEGISRWKVQRLSNLNSKSVEKYLNIAGNCNFIEERNRRYFLGAWGDDYLSDPEVQASLKTQNLKLFS